MDEDEIMDTSITTSLGPPLPSTEHNDDQSDPESSSRSTTNSRHSTHATNDSPGLSIFVTNLVVEVPPRASSPTQSTSQSKSTTTTTKSKTDSVSDDSVVELFAKECFYGGSNPANQAANLNPRGPSESTNNNNEIESPIVTATLTSTLDWANRNRDDNDGDETSPMDCPSLVEQTSKSSKTMNAAAAAVARTQQSTVEESVVIIDDEEKESASQIEDTVRQLMNDLLVIIELDVVTRDSPHGSYNALHSTHNNLVSNSNSLMYV